MEKPFIFHECFFCSGRGGVGWGGGELRPTGERFCNPRVGALVVFFGLGQTPSIFNSREKLRGWNCCAGAYLAGSGVTFVRG